MVLWAMLVKQRSDGTIVVISISKDAELEQLIDFLAFGLTGWNWLAIVGFTLVVTHITIAAVTIYLHRCQAHRAVELHAIVSHFFRFWLWLTTGMVTGEWPPSTASTTASARPSKTPQPPGARLSKVLWEVPTLSRGRQRPRHHNPLWTWLPRRLD